MIGSQLPLSGVVSLERVVNVAQVKHRSPFRYPGGKTWLVPRIRQWLGQKTGVRNFVEPFAGGAIVGLSVAFDNLAERVTLIELDDQVSAVWQTVLQGAERDVNWLVKKITSFEMSRDNVLEAVSRRCRNTREVAFLTILKNRVNHGGVLAEGAGMIKDGENGRGIGSRWYPETIARRILDLQQVRHKIDFIQMDAFEYVSNQSLDGSCVFFVDPPYSVAGTRLYRHYSIDHDKLFRAMSQTVGDVLITYDNAPEIAALASMYGLQTRHISMSNKNHSLQKELLIGRDFRWL